MSGPLSAMRIMLVDDNPHMRDIVANILEGLGVRHVCRCANGVEALEQLRTWRADLAIVDFRMAPVDGVEFTYLVRNAADSADPYLPIIMISGYADKIRVYEARDAGVTEFIVKPLTVQALVDRINAVIFRPRAFVKTEDYHGPCRRRRDDPAFEGPYRRSTDAEALKQATV